MDRDPCLKRLCDSAPNQAYVRRIDTFCKSGAIYHQYFVESEKDRLSDLQKEERDAAVMKTRQEFHEKSTRRSSLANDNSYGS
jgi:hypothetical protein